MNEEIKEILDRAKKLKYKCDCCEEIAPGKYIMKDDKQTDNLIEAVYIIDKLLNYITNLQEENKMLKKELKNKPDCEWTLETKDGQIMTIIQSERIDMQEKLNKSIQELFDENQKLVKVIDELEKRLNKYFVGTMSDAVLNKLTELKGGSDEKSND